MIQNDIDEFGRIVGQVPSWPALDTQARARAAAVKAIEAIGTFGLTPAERKLTAKLIDNWINLSADTKEMRDAE